MRRRDVGLGSALSENATPQPSGKPQRRLVGESEATSRDARAHESV